MLCLWTKTIDNILEAADIKRLTGLSGL